MSKLTIFSVISELYGKSWKQLTPEEQANAQAEFRRRKGPALTAEQKKARAKEKAQSGQVKDRTAKDAVKSIAKQEERASAYAAANPEKRAYKRKPPKSEDEKYQSKKEVAEYFEKKWGGNTLRYGKEIPKKVDFTMSITAMSFVPRSDRQIMEIIVDSAAIIAMAARKHTVKQEHVLAALYTYNRSAPYNGVNYLALPLKKREFSIPDKMQKFSMYSELLDYTTY